MKDLAARAGLAMERVRFQLGCLERRYFISFGEEDRDGFGSGRGIRADWTVQLTSMGVAAVELASVIRGDRRALAHAVRRSVCEAADHHAARDYGGQAGLAESLALALRRVAGDFNPLSPLPIELCANTIRVLGNEPVSVNELARLAGVAPESCAIGWQVKPYVVAGRWPAVGAGREWS